MKRPAKKKKNGWVRQNFLKAKCFSMKVFIWKLSLTIELGHYISRTTCAKVIPRFVFSIFIFISFHFISLGLWSQGRSGKRTWSLNEPVTHWKKRYVSVLDEKGKPKELFKGKPHAVMKGLNKTKICMFRQSAPDVIRTWWSDDTPRYTTTAVQSNAHLI